MYYVHYILWKHWLFLNIYDTIWYYNMFNFDYIMIIWSDIVQWVMTLWNFWCPSLLLQYLSIYFNDLDVSNLGSGQASQVVDSFDELPVDFIRKVSGWIHLGEYKETLPESTSVAGVFDLYGKACFLQGSSSAWKINWLKKSCTSCS